MSYSSEVLADSPYLYWKQDEPSGTSATDSSPNARTGTYVGTPTLAQPTLVPSDTSGFSVDYNASSQWILSSSATFNSANATIEVWFNYDGTSVPAAGKYIFISGCSQGESSGTNDKNICIDQNKKAVFYIFDGAGVFSVGATTLTAGTYHLVGTCNSSAVKIYVNGVEDGTIAGGGSYTGYASANVLVAGRAAPAANPINTRIAGKRDEFAVYGSALSAVRILAHYNAALSSGIFYVRA